MRTPRPGAGRRGHFTDDQIRDIRARGSDPEFRNRYALLGLEFNVSGVMIWKIAKRKLYKHVPDA